MPDTQISGSRKALYYAGTAIIILGLLLFFSTFFLVFSDIGPCDTWQSSIGTMVYRAIGGMALLFIGAILRMIGVRGLAGSGVVLDPDKARDDLEPWARMAGGIVKDAADEAGVTPGAASNRDMPFDERLRRLARLHAEGILTDEEFAAEKQKILNEG